MPVAPIGGKSPINGTKKPAAAGGPSTTKGTAELAAAGSDGVASTPQPQQAASAVSEGPGSAAAGSSGAKRPPPSGISGLFGAALRDLMKIKPAQQEAAALP